MAKYKKYETLEPDEVHSFHIVSFHAADLYSNTKSQSRFSYYSIGGIPYHVYDGRYRPNTIYIDEYEINASGARQIHLLEMSISKSIDGSTLSFGGEVTNLESDVFNGFLLVFITENQLIDPTYPDVTWNFVFRDYGLNKTLSLTGLSRDTFDGTWSIPINVDASKIQVIAAAYDIRTRDPGYDWPYAVQSVCDVCGHSMAIPEFSSTWILLFGFSCMMVILLCKHILFRTEQ